MEEKLGCETITSTPVWSQASTLSEGVINVLLVLCGQTYPLTMPIYGLCVNNQFELLDDGPLPHAKSDP